MSNQSLLDSLFALGSSEEEGTALPKGGTVGQFMFAPPEVQDETLINPMRDVYPKPKSLKRLSTQVEKTKGDLNERSKYDPIFFPSPKEEEKKRVAEAQVLASTKPLYEQIFDSAKSFTYSTVRGFNQTLGSGIETATQINQAQGMNELKTNPYISEEIKQQGLEEYRQERLKNIRLYQQQSKVANYFEHNTDWAVDDIIPGFWNQTVPEALGSAVGFIAGGLAGTAMGVPPWMTAGAMGVGMKYGDIYQEALKYGATDEEAVFAGLVASPTGAFEGVPVAAGLGRMEKASGGLLSKTLAEKLSQAAGTKLGAAAAAMPLVEKVAAIGQSAALGAFEETIQEMVDAGWTNYAAKNISGYDPKRKLFEGVGEAGAAGGVVGGFLNAVGTAYGLKVRPSRKQAEWDKHFEDRAKDLYAVRGQDGKVIDSLPSKAIEVVEQAGLEEATITEWDKLLRSKGVKFEELKNSPWEFLSEENKKKPNEVRFTKEQIRKVLEINALEFQEQWVSSEELEQKYGDQDIPWDLEGELEHVVSYKAELADRVQHRLFFLNSSPKDLYPQKLGNANLGAHFTGLPNTTNLAHARISELATKNGKIWHIDELQSDAAAAVAKQRENLPPEQRDSVPVSPKEEHWERIALTRLIQKAQEQGVDYITLSKAKDQVDLYGTDEIQVQYNPENNVFSLGYTPLVLFPRSTIAPIEFIPTANGTLDFEPTQLQRFLDKTGLSKEKLDRHLMRGMKHIRENPQNPVYKTRPRETGMKEAYDIRIPNRVNKILKGTGISLTQVELKKHDLLSPEGNPVTETYTAIPIRLLGKNITRNLYSTQGTPSGLTKADVETHLEKIFGKAFAKLLKIGRIVVVDKVSDLPGGNHPADTTGLFHKDGTTYLVAENVSEEDLKGLVLHEVGVHSGLRLMLGEKLWQEVLDQVAQLEAKGDPATVAAAGAVSSRTAPENRLEEILASLVQQNANPGLVAKIIAGIRAWWFQLTGSVNLTPDDFAALARSAVKMQTKREFQQELGKSEFSYAYRKRDKVLAEVSATLKQKIAEKEAELGQYEDDLQAEEDRLLVIDDVQESIHARAMAENWTVAELELADKLIQKMLANGWYGNFLEPGFREAVEFNDVKFEERVPAGYTAKNNPPYQKRTDESPLDFLIRSPILIHWDDPKTASTKAKKQMQITEEVFAMFQRDFFDKYITIPYRILETITNTGNVPAAALSFWVEDKATNTQMLAANLWIRDETKDYMRMHESYIIAHELSHIFHEALAAEAMYGMTIESRTRAKRLLHTIADTYIQDVVRLSRKVEPEYIRFAFNTNIPQAGESTDMTDQSFKERLDTKHPSIWSMRWGFREVEMFANYIETHWSPIRPIKAFPVPALDKSELLRTAENAKAALPRSEDFPLKVLMAPFAVEAQMNKLQEDIAKLRALNPIEALWKGYPGEDPKVRKQWGVDLDRWNRFIENGLNLHQIASINPHILPLQKYLQWTKKWNVSKKEHEDRANDILRDMKDLGREQYSALSDVLLEESVERLALTNEEREKRLGPEARIVYTRIQSHMKFILQEMMDTALAEAARVYADNPVELGLKEAEIRQSYGELFQMPFFPLMRFGDKGVSVHHRETGKLVEFHLVETEAERKALIKELRSQYGETEYSTSHREVAKPDLMYQGLPLNFTLLLEKNLIATGQPLTPEQKQTMKDLSYDYLPAKSFKKHFKKRKGIAGFNKDIARSLAAYTQSAAGHLARVKYGHLMLAEVEALRENAKQVAHYAPPQVKDNSQRERIANWMMDHYNYIMSPDSEWAALRSFGFLWYLGYNVKSAFVNASQIPLITFPALAADFNEVSAGVELAKATKLATQVYFDPDNVDKNLPKLIEQGTAEGWLDQSLATELAIASTAGMTDRFIPLDILGELGRKQYTQLGKHAYYKVAHYGSLPFHLIEKMNRQITAIAAYNLSRDKGKTHEEAVAYAESIVYRTQYEYSKYNRPKFMRGNASVLFLFKNYVQNTLFFAFYDRGGWRFLMMLLLVAGLYGLPGAEDLLDLFDTLGTQFKKQLGMKDPYVDMRKEIREEVAKFTDALGTDPDLFLHGLGRHSMGLKYLADEMGLPFPDVNISSSLSMGNLVPGTERNESSTGNQYEKIGRMAEAIGGPVASLGVGITRAISANDLDYWKRSEYAMPTAMRNLSKAARYTSRGQEATKNGEPIAEFNVSSTEDRLEIAAQAMGFMPTKVSQGWEGYIAKQNAVGFYDTWKTELLAAHNHALEEKDQEGKKEAMDEIVKYNNRVPYPEMKVTRDLLERSWKSYKGARVKASRGQVYQNQYVRLGEEYQAAYAKLEAGDTTGTGTNLRTESEPSTFEQLLRTPLDAQTEPVGKESR